MLKEDWDFVDEEELSEEGKEFLKIPNKVLKEIYDQTNITNNT